MSPVPPPPPPVRRRASTVATWALVFLLALAVNALGVAGLAWWLPAPAQAARAPMSVVFVPPPPPVEEDPDRQEDVAPDAQLVETAKPDQEVTPEQADYLAEYDNAVERETRLDEYRVNPDVVADTLSEEDTQAEEQVEDVAAEDPGDGAEAGNDTFAPDRDGLLAALPSTFTLSNRDGDDAPMAASERFAALSGAPQNDLLVEELGDRVALNTRAFQFAAYLTQVRRMVNEAWAHNLHNLHATTPLTRAAYTTEVRVVLSPSGTIADLAVTRSADVRELDDAVTRAYAMAAPFPTPPAGLIDPDGQVHLPMMGWTAQFRGGQQAVRSADPRAGELFPGIVKTPR